VKYLVRSMKLSDAKALADKALTLTSAKEIYALCDEFSLMRVKVS
jgi:phosphoenolpyruvate-protein phosphotransferase (PTS system enzyme I)